MFRLAYLCYVTYTESEHANYLEASGATLPDEGVAFGAVSAPKTPLTPVVI